MPGTTTVPFREFRKNLSGYLRQARQGAEFIVTSRGREVARVGPPDQTARRRRALIGMFKGQFRMAPDFDETPADLIAAMEVGEQHIVLTAGDPCGDSPPPHPSPGSAAIGMLA